MGIFSWWKEPPDPLMTLAGEIAEMRRELAEIKQQISRYTVRTDDLITGMMDLYKAENDDIAALHRDIAKLLPITVSVPQVPSIVIEPDGRMYSADDPNVTVPDIRGKYAQSQAHAAEFAEEIAVDFSGDFAGDITDDFTEGN